MDRHHHAAHVHADEGVADVHAQRGPVLKTLHHDGIGALLVVGRDAGSARVGVGADPDLREAQLLCVGALEAQ